MDNVIFKQGNALVNKIFQDWIVLFKLNHV